MRFLTILRILTIGALVVAAPAYCAGKKAKKSTQPSALDKYLQEALKRWLRCSLRPARSGLPPRG